MTKQKPAKISLFGHFGTGNFGNEATLLAIVSRLRVLFPTCELCCVCSYPENVVETLGIDAVPHTVRSVRIWNRQVPLAKRLRMAFVGLSEEPREYLRAWRTLKGTDVFIIPGTGLITDAHALAGWGPYGVFKWSVVAKLRGCRVMFVSVGVGPVRRASGRFLVKSALSLADYRSYRDARSKEVLEEIGLRTTDDPIYPDLVFGLSGERSTVAARKGRPIVGVGLMEYPGTYSAANPKRETYERYLESFAVFVGWLLDQEYDVELLLGDADIFVIDDFTAVLQKRLGSRTAQRVTYRPTNSVPEFLSHLSATDFVVATRFHNILMSLLLNKPVVAISFHDKCSSLMSEMGLSEYCHDIHRMSADVLIEQFQALVGNADDVKQLISQRVETAKRALDEQYEALFGDVGDHQQALDVAAAAT